MPNHKNSQTQVGRPRDDQLDDAIHQATLSLLAEVGYLGVTIAEVARRACTVPPTVYRRHRGVKELILTSLKTEMASLPQAVPDLGSLRGDLIAYVRQIAHQLTPQRAAVVAGLLIPMRQDAALAEVMRQGLETVIANNWGAILDRAIHRGELHPQVRNLGLLGWVASSMVFHRITLLQLPVDEPCLSEFVDTVLLPVLFWHQTQRETKPHR